MRHEIKNGVLEIWQTGSSHNDLYMKSTNVEKCNNRQIRFNILDYLENLQSDEKVILETINKIKEINGRFLRYKSIPRLTRSGSYQTHVGLNHLKSTIQEYIEGYNLDLNPPFQRGHVWNDEQRVKFLEYMLRDGKINPIYFNCKNFQMFRTTKPEMVVVDGLQRLTTLLMFIDDKIRVFKELDEDGLGFLYSEFDLFRLSSDSSIRININDLEDDKEILQWYVDLNEGGTPHSKEEIDRVKNMIKELI